MLSLSTTERRLTNYMNRTIQWLLQTEIGRRIEIQLLMNLVTFTLRLPNQSILLKPSSKALDIFAAFTAKHLASCNNEQQQQLHAKSLRLGAMLRRCLTNRNNEALTSLTFLLYRNIGISMEGCFPGKVIIRKCHFCHHYSPQICSIASLMDSGVISGLFGDGKLVFSERMTEGHHNCICELSHHQNIK